MAEKSPQMAALEAGDIIDVVAPGSASSVEDVHAAMDYLKSLGFIPRMAEDAIDRDHPFHSNTDEHRFEFLKTALLAKDSKAIWCLRGGYGGLRLIPALLRLPKPKKPKLIIGYSDITSLHLFVNQKWNWQSLHGPLLENGRPGRVEPKCLDELFHVLTGEETKVAESIVPINGAASKLKLTKSTLCGGNLAVLTSHCGTKLSLNSKGKIVVLEDIGERGYRIDRMLQQMSQAGSFAGSVAIVFGEFSNGLEKNGRDLTSVAIERFAAESKIPVFVGLTMGHGFRNRPWFFNTLASIAGGKNPQIVVKAGIKS